MQKRFFNGAESTSRVAAKTKECKFNLCGHHYVMLAQVRNARQTRPLISKSKGQVAPDYLSVCLSICSQSAVSHTNTHNLSIALDAPKRTLHIISHLLSVTSCVYRPYIIKILLINNCLYMYTELQSAHCDAVEQWDTIVKLAQQSTVRELLCV